MAHIEDQWTSPNRDPKGPSRIRNRLWGHGVRYRAVWNDETRRRHRRSFATFTEAQSFLDDLAAQRQEERKRMESVLPLSAFTRRELLAELLRREDGRRRPT